VGIARGGSIPLDRTKTSQTSSSEVTTFVFVRTTTEMAEISANNPFPDAPFNRSVAIFLDAAPPRDALDHVVGRKDELIALGRREIYVHYGDGMAKSKLRIKAGTARNLNTVAKLAELAAKL
jgi:uncharacterized protein (DUF1697 family)